jgi:demethylmenaquinone methyltransferase/2-methoxy-6-polyprenyl-1,4-benzoquinol methylase
VKRFFTGTGSTYDLIVTLFTYGADRYWKRKILSTIPNSDKILDIACGTGILTFKLAERHPHARIVGIDVMAEYILVAKRKMENRTLSNIQFVCARAEELKLRQTFDCITSSYIPKYVSADKLLENISPYLREGGLLVLHDFAYPTIFLFRKIWEIHMLMMKYLGPRMFPQWKTVFFELADLVRSSQWINHYRSALNHFKYNHIKVQRLTAGSAAILSERKS